MFTEGFWKENKWAALILFSLAFILYGYSITFDQYVLDDKIVISENNFVKSGTKGIKDILGNDTFTGYLGQQKDLVVGKGSKSHHNNMAKMMRRNREGGGWFVPGFSASCRL